VLLERELSIPEVTEGAFGMAVLVAAANPRWEKLRAEWFEFSARSRQNVHLLNMQNNIRLWLTNCVPEAGCQRRFGLQPAQGCVFKLV
jgi:hypothetical protein